MEMTVELFDSIINTSQDCVFWKDAKRRFLGVNQAFLDFYGFKSADELIGKTDEDMGWHSDPEPFKQDELLVLGGRSTYKVQGKCIVRGEERDIIASKRPLYDGNKVVGLVGSFVDITDVLRRNNGSEHSRRVYDVDKLRKFAFFDHIIDEVSLDEILDPLTGILSRGYSMKFVRSLISEQTPFTFIMLDLDNFKYINDSFGHIAGDLVLSTVAKSLAEALDGIGLAGRFGGDELLLINLKDTEASDVTDFLNGLYTGGAALRIEVDFENGSAFVTGTSGSATFPKDADNFTDLFGIIDKMLYLGKSKGRNCFNVYNEAEHKDVEITKIAKNGVFTDMQDIRRATEKAKTIEGKLKAAMPLLSEILKIRDLFYVKDDGVLRSVNDPGYNGDASDISKLVTGDVFSGSTLEHLSKDAPVFKETLQGRGLESVLVVAVRQKDEIKGYLVCAAERSLRIWQDNETAVLYYLAGLLT